MSDLLLVNESGYPISITWRDGDNGPYKRHLIMAEKDFGISIAELTRATFAVEDEAMEPKQLKHGEAFVFLYRGGDEFGRQANRCVRNACADQDDNYWVDSVTHTVHSFCDDDLVKVVPECYIGRE